MKRAGLFIQSVIYIFAGINHFWHPAFYKPIMPSWIPWHYPLIYTSGAAEILCGLFLLPAATRRHSAWALVLLLIAIYPANIQMAITYAQEKNPSLWIALLRLPMQFLLIGWAWMHTKKEPA
ncbi:MAG: DoxX family protein [Chitinophagaceae bacterium]|nr:DoxX family protein [Chitinophagaceae bacterium]